MTHRPFLPTHDFYSYIAGMMIILAIVKPLKELYRILNPKIIHRRKSIHRNSFRRHRNIGGMVGNPDLNETPNFEETNDQKKWNSWLRFQASYVGRLVYLGVLVGVVIPLMMGLVINIFVLQRFGPLPIGSSHVFYYIQDWAMGCIYIKVLYNITMILRPH